MSPCSDKINSYCYICGRYVLLENRVAISEKVEDSYAFYFAKTIRRRQWTPNICCKFCYNSLHEWTIGKRNSMPFGTPMEWKYPGAEHDPKNCYVCVNNVEKRNRKLLKKFSYRDVPSAILPREHTEDNPVPKRPSPQSANITTADELTNAPSIPGAMFPSPSEFVPQTVTKPILLTEPHLHSIARNLALGKKNRKCWLWNSMRYICSRQELM